MGLNTWCFGVLLLILLISQMTPSDSCKVSNRGRKMTQTTTKTPMTTTTRAATVAANKTTEINLQKGSYLQGPTKFGYPQPEPTVLNIMNLVCGTERLSKIIDESKALTHSWPWVTGLYKAAIIAKNNRMIADRDPSPFCTASMISPQYLITAMHCLMNLNAPTLAILPKKTWFRPEAYLSHKIFVKFGNHYSGGYSSLFKDEHIVREAMVYTEGLNYPMHDIALLKLEQRANFSDGVMPVCIPPNKLKLPVGSECFAVGVNEFEDSNSTNELIEIKMPIRKMEDCQQISNFAHDDHHICAGNEEQVTSRGRSGGGIYCKLHPDDDQYYLLGVASSEDSRPGPRLFASVSDVSEWINQSVDA